MESTHEVCLCHELVCAALGSNVKFHCRSNTKVLKLECGYRLDVVVGDAVILELKCVERVLPVHVAQVMTCLKMTVD